MRNGAYTDIRKGLQGTDRQLGLIVKYIRDDQHQSLRERAELDAYLTKLGLKNLPNLSDAQVLEAVSTEFGGFIEAMDQGIEVLNLTFHMIRNPERHVTLFKPEERDLVEQAVAWLFVEGGRQAADDPDLEPIEAIAAGEKWIGTRLSEYQEFALAWWEWEPWSFVKALGRRGAIGMSMCLPVSPQAYDLIRSGQRRIFRMRPDEGQMPTANIFMEGLAMHPKHARAPMNVALVIACFCQQARLSTKPGMFEDEALRILTYHGPLTSARRARKFGYQDIPGRMLGTNIGFMERTLTLHGEGVKDARLIGIWKGLQQRLIKIYGPVRRSEATVGVVVSPEAVTR